jgi:hypothetical protein
MTILTTSLVSGSTVGSGGHGWRNRVRQAASTSNPRDALASHAVDQPRATQARKSARRDVTDGALLERFSGGEVGVFDRFAEMPTIRPFSCQIAARQSFSAFVWLRPLSSACAGLCGIRTFSGPVNSATYRFQSADIARIAVAAVAPCTPSHAGLSPSGWFTPGNFRAARWRVSDDYVEGIDVRISASSSPVPCRAVHRFR